MNVHDDDRPQAGEFCALDLGIGVEFGSLIRRGLRRHDLARVSMLAALRAALTASTSAGTNDGIAARRSTRRLSSASAARSGRLMMLP